MRDVMVSATMINMDMNMNLNMIVIVDAFGVTCVVDTVDTRYIDHVPCINGYTPQNSQKCSINGDSKINYHSCPMLIDTFLNHAT